MLSAPAGFKANAAGLLVPEEIARERQVMTWQDWRDLERVTKSLKARGITLQLKCDDPRCQRTPIIRFRTQEGGIGFRCEHADRVYSKAMR